MRVIPLEKPKDESPSLKGFRVMEITNRGLTYYTVEKKVFGLFWEAVTYTPPGHTAQFPVMFEKKATAIEFIKNVVVAKAGRKIAWKG